MREYNVTIFTKVFANDREDVVELFTKILRDIAKINDVSDEPLIHVTDSITYRHTNDGLITMKLDKRKGDL